VAKRFLRIQDIADLQEHAKKALREVSTPLRGMGRNFTESERVGVAYFLAALTVLNQMTNERISDKIEVKFDDLDPEPVE
jgi:hypothetical protein